MKKILFTCIAILYTVPSIADCAFGLLKTELPMNTATGKDTKYIEDEFTIIKTNEPDKIRYLQCGPNGATNDSFVYCSNNSQVLGGDGHIYQCDKNNQWIQLNDTDFPDCSLDKIMDRDSPNGSYLTANKHTLNYIFFPNYETYHKIKNNDICKMTLQDYHTKEDECMLQGGEFMYLDKVCNTNETKNLTVYVKDANNNMPLSGVSFTYPQMNLEENKMRNIATAEEQGTYTIPVSKYMGLVDIQISKNAYVSQILSAKELQNQTITLASGQNTDANGSQSSKDRSKIINDETERENALLAMANDELSKQNGAQNTNTDAKQPNVPTSSELEEKLKTAQDALKKAQDKENSWANRAVSATSTAASGVGGMMAASALAERRADAAAEAEMQDYISTMKCEYGGGKEYNLGTDEVTLPGGNELLEYYTEYKTLADNLKTTKAALGLRAGIESEVLYDRAQSGLYQYANTGKTGGGETSLFRALTDAESTDATAWNDQKDASTKQLYIGGGAAAVGVVGGATGNYFINRDKKEADSKK